MKIKLPKSNRQSSVVRCWSYPGRSTLEFILDWCSLASLSGTLRSTGVENIRQISLFLQNKPNSPIVQMNLTHLSIMNYAISNSLTKVKNKPNQTQFKAKNKPCPEHTCPEFYRRSRTGQSQSLDLKRRRIYYIVNNKLKNYIFLGAY
jgi:hypothetical protein